MSNTEQYELIRLLFAALKDVVRQIPNDEGLADWRLDLAESAESKAIQFFKNNQTPPVQGVEEAAVKSAEDIYNYYCKKNGFDNSDLPQNVWYKKDVIDFLRYASQFQAPRSKGVGMQWVKSSDKCPLELNASKTSKVTGNLILRIDGAYPATGYFSSSEGRIYCYYEGRYFPNESRAGSFMSNEFDRIEYLSESAPLSDNSPAEGGGRCWTK